MIPILFLPKLLIAGGSSFLGTLEIPPVAEISNHTLLGEKIPAAKVVCRDRWGTPMLPDGKGGYSLIAPIDHKLIAESLWIPPASGERPVPAPTPAAAPPILLPSGNDHEATKSAGLPHVDLPPGIGTIPTLPAAPAAPAAPTVAPATTTTHAK